MFLTVLAQAMDIMQHCRFEFPSKWCGLY